MFSSPNILLVDKIFRHQIFLFYFYFIFLLRSRVTILFHQLTFWSLKVLCGEQKISSPIIIIIFFPSYWVMNIFFVAYKFLSPKVLCGDKIFSKNPCVDLTCALQSIQHLYLAMNPLLNPNLTTVL
jgi:hypothetical protein